MTNKHKITQLSLALLNCQTITDKKIPFINTITKTDSVIFLTETNVNTPERRNILTHDDAYSWTFIPKNDSFSQRLAIRKPSSCKNTNVEIIDHAYFTQNRARVDQSACQILHTKMRMSFLNFTAALVYRAPDANDETNTKLYDWIESNEPDVLLGDLNLDFFEKSIKKILYEKINMKQLVKSGTRENRQPNGRFSATLIDHFWVKAKLAHRFKPKVVDISEYSISDHKLVRITTDLYIPPVKLTLPREVDRFRRYQSGHVDWSTFSPKIDPHEFSLLDTKEQSERLVSALSLDCEQHDITFKKSLPDKKIWTFTFRKETKNAKKYKISCDLKARHANIRYEVMKVNPLASSDQIQAQRNILEKSRDEFRIARNRFNNLKRNDKNSFFAKEHKNDQKSRWEIVNRSKGKISLKMSDITKNPRYTENNMVNFFWSRTKLAADSVYDEAAPIDRSFPIKVQLSETAKNVPITLTNDIIDQVMTHKASPSPDPDGLSMQIWSAVYQKNTIYRDLIRKHFYKVFSDSEQIPGLTTHDVRLHPKCDPITREKDLRPIASLASVPKRMLKVVFDQIKKHDKNIFFSKNDFSAPGRGTVPAILSTYETLERFHSGSRGVPIPNHETRWIMLDYSNAFATYNKNYVIDNLQLSGKSRSLVCNSIADQTEFRVRTKQFASIPYQFDVGGPQGQCGSCEVFASIGKTITIPDIETAEVEHLIPIRQRKKAQTPKKKEVYFVDDRSITLSAHKDAIDYCQDKIINSISEQSKAAGLALNEEKTEIMKIKSRPVKVTKFLGAQLNSDLNAKHEFEATCKNLRSAVAAVQATSSLDKFNRVEISKSKVFSCLTYLVFIFTYASTAQVKELGRQIILNFKKAAYLHMQTPTVTIEKYLFGMPFHDYCRLRFMRTASKMVADENEIFQEMHEMGRNGKLKPKRASPIGTFSKKYIETVNGYNFDTLDKTHKNANKRQFFSQIIIESAKIKKKYAELRKAKKLERRRNKT